MANKVDKALKAERSLGWFISMSPPRGPKQKLIPSKGITGMSCEPAQFSQPRSKVRPAGDHRVSRNQATPTTRNKINSTTEHHDQATQVFHKGCIPPLMSLNWILECSRMEFRPISTAEEQSS